MRHLLTLLLLGSLFATVPAPGWALSPAQQEEFQRIASLSLKNLNQEARQLLQQRYDQMDWQTFNLPDYARQSELVETGYRIAVLRPELLAAFPCYCFCDAIGHHSLRDCFGRPGLLGWRFDPHGANCDICLGQAMLALLWAELGATDATISAGFATKFTALTEKHGHPVLPE